MKNRLIINQLDAKFEKISGISNLDNPASGWITSIRKAIGMSLEQLGKRLSITKQSAKELEQREKDGSISVRSLREAAAAMDMKLVYWLIPKDGTLDALIERKAKEIATQVVMRTSNTMKLEDQENSSDRIQQAIRERTQIIKQEMPKLLWD
jgi:predicted DNA-binding mobile mystery protein A